MQAEEGAAYGAALLAGVGAGLWPSVDAACDAVVRVAQRTEANPETVRVVGESYAKYRRIYPALLVSSPTGPCLRRDGNPEVADWGTKEEMFPFGILVALVERGPRLRLERCA